MWFVCDMSLFTVCKTWEETQLQRAKCAKCNQQINNCTCARAGRIHKKPIRFTQAPTTIAQRAVSHGGRVRKARKAPKAPKKSGGFINYPTAGSPSERTEDNLVELLPARVIEYINMQQTDEDKAFNDAIEAFAAFAEFVDNVVKAGFDANADNAANAGFKAIEDFDAFEDFDANAAIAAIAAIAEELKADTS